MMENTSTEVLSSTANHSFSGAGDGGNASELSGWTSYIDYFMETQRRQEEEASSAASSTDDVGGRSTSQYSGGDGAVAGSSRLPALVESSEASRRLSLKKEGGRMRMKVMYDESLEDTATSPISSPKLIELRESDANHQKKEDTRDEFSHYYKKTTAAEELLAGYHNLSNNGANRTIDMIGHDSEYDSNELNKEGLLLSSCTLFPSIAHPS